MYVCWAPDLSALRKCLRGVLKTHELVVHERRLPNGYTHYVLLICWLNHHDFISVMYSINFSAGGPVL